MLLAKASLDVKQPKTSLNCIVMIRGLRQSPEAAATETPIIANHDNDTGVQARSLQSPGSPRNSEEIPTLVTPKCGAAVECSFKQGSLIPKNTLCCCRALLAGIHRDARAHPAGPG